MTRSARIVIGTAALLLLALISIHQTVRCAVAGYRLGEAYHVYREALDERRRLLHEGAADADAEADLPVQLADPEVADGRSP